jgi:hypothetical protein
MDNQIETLKNLWENSRSKESGDSANTGHIIKMAKEKMKRTRRMQLDTILILSITLAIIALYFTQVVQLNETLSRIGAVLMTGGLAVRILIDCYSIYLSSKLDPADSAFNSNRATLVYHRFRKLINGPVTVVILLLYSVGFYMLTPLFYRIFNLPVLILIDASYGVIAFIFIGYIRRTIRQEMSILREIMQIEEELSDPQPYLDKEID